MSGHNIQAIKPYLDPLLSKMKQIMISNLKLDPGKSESHRTLIRSLLELLLKAAAVSNMNSEPFPCSKSCFTLAVNACCMNNVGVLAALGRVDRTAIDQTMAANGHSCSKNSTCNSCKTLSLE
eukprot:TRINITY_DN10271_c0_g1_i3.p1 TRINITY_DN10271_c0_g1~~TRINITY_DN10271_c0_g1_i3.p1  ORF type:complete len:123 (+),score=5.78 TRINITY_DN10271_c0_g1_i3:57-425(+)